MGTGVVLAVVEALKVTLLGREKADVLIELPEPSALEALFNRALQVFKAAPELTLADLESWVETRGLPAFRARQIFRWVWKRGALIPYRSGSSPTKMRG